ncbi:MAG TPA: hypothetical protein VHK67_00640 [Rhabdochlamydiaceae bacterium]|jgi:hypothetical protein|nr:hypothetical protein [Rhabdochlamydiaceae bacterium]
MTKRLLLVFSVLFVVCIPGCSDMKQMNTNLEESIQTVKENTSTVSHSSEVIAKNSKEIAVSTQTMRTYLPLVLVVIIVILFIPSFLLLRLQRKFLQDIKILVEWLQKP